MLWALFERYSSELLSTVETIEINKELIEIGPNKVYDITLLLVQALLRSDLVSGKL